MTGIKFPKIIGILNVTPDSFSDGGKYYDQSLAVDQAIRLLDQGADIIDIGGESSRPGATKVDEIEEMKRVIPVIKQVIKKRPESIISIDTMKFNVAKAALNEGATIINDVSGLDYDSRLAELAAQFNAHIILMHMKGRPGNMQKNPVYENVVNEIFENLSQKINKAKKAGVKSIIADAGIGFGKTVQHNLELIKNYEKFHKLGVEIILGISRKSFIGAIIGIEKPEDRDFATIIYHTMLLNKNINYVRLHNIELGMLMKNIFYSINE